MVNPSFSPAAAAALMAERQARQLLERAYQEFSAPQLQFERIHQLLDGAIAHFTAAIQSDPSWLSAFIGRAEATLLQFYLNNNLSTERIVQDYTTVIDTLCRSESMATAWQSDAAQDWLLTAYQGRAYVLRRLNPAQALLDIEACLELLPKARFYLMKAELAFMQGNWSASAKSSLEALRLITRPEKPFYEDYRKLYEALSAMTNRSLQLALLQEFWLGTDSWNIYRTRPVAGPLRH